MLENQDLLTGIDRNLGVPLKARAITGIGFASVTKVGGFINQLLPEWAQLL